MAVVQRTRTGPAPEEAEMLRIVGLIMVISSLVAGVLITFVLPANKYAIAGLLLFSFGGFIVGMGMLIARKVMLRKARR